MLKKVITLALVTALVLVASGVALAEIGVFDTRQVEQAAGQSDDVDGVGALEETIEDDSDLDGDSDLDDDSDDDSDDSDDSDDPENSDMDDDSDDETVLLRTELSGGGPFSYPAGVAGSVQFARDGSRLQLLAVEVNSGWFVAEQEVESDEIEIEFHDCDTKVEFEAEYDDGEIKLEVKSSSDDHDDGCFEEPVAPGEPVVYQAAEAGTITIVLQGSSLKLIGVNLNPGWFVAEQEVEIDEVEIEFHNGSTEVEFTAEYDDGQINFEVESSRDESDD